MRQLATLAFRAERARFELRFTCEHCTYFDVGDQRCMHGYPNDEHREARYAEPSASLLFCKEFELF